MRNLIIYSVPEDPILGITVAYNKDPSPKKINLGVGAYRDDNGKPFVLDCVRKAEKRILESNLDHEYAPIGGIPAFTNAAQALQLGSSHPIIKEKRAVTVQTLSGTGALRVASDFAARWLNIPNWAGKPIYMPAPTWANHENIFRDSGMTHKFYKYYDAKTCGLDFNGMKSDISNLPNGSFLLFHACAHNPTGVDPSLDQWKQLSALCKVQSHQH
jgi:aspartate aminotransferase